MASLQVLRPSGELDPLASPKLPGQVGRFLRVHFVGRKESTKQNLVNPRYQGHMSNNCVVTAGVLAEFKCRSARKKHKRPREDMSLEPGLGPENSQTFLRMGRIPYYYELTQNKDV